MTLKTKQCTHHRPVSRIRRGCPEGVIRSFVTGFKNTNEQPISISAWALRSVGAHMIQRVSGGSGAWVHVRSLSSPQTVPKLPYGADLVQLGRACQRASGRATPNPPTPPHTHPARADVGEAPKERGDQHGWYTTEQIHKVDAPRPAPRCGCECV